MYLHDGFVCGESTKDEMMKVQGVKVLNDRIMLITFTTGETRLFDSTILNGPAFTQLDDNKIFSNPKVVHGVVTWHNEEIDCAPEYMYEHSYEYITDEHSVIYEKL